MRVNSEMLSVHITTINRMLELIGAESKLHIERFNGYTWIKTQRGETIAVGTPAEVYKQLAVVRNVLYSIPNK